MVVDAEINIRIYLCRWAMVMFQTERNCAKTSSANLSNGLLTTCTLKSKYHLQTCFWERYVLHAIFKMINCAFQGLSLKFQNEDSSVHTWPKHWRCMLTTPSQSNESSYQPACDFRYYQYMYKTKYHVLKVSLHICYSTALKDTSVALY